MVDSVYYQQHWQNPGYLEGTRAAFDNIDRYLKTPPRRILDIGCGFAHISGMFQKKYGTELWLLEGDFLDNDPNSSRKNKFGPAEEFQFYSTVADLRRHWDSQSLTYNFVNARDIHIDSEVKFDFVSSWLSCGYHYPVSTYKALIQAHTDNNSTIIMDFRRKKIPEQLVDIEVVGRVDEGVLDRKQQTLHFKFKN